MSNQPISGSFQSPPPQLAPEAKLLARISQIEHTLERRGVGSIAVLTALMITSLVIPLVISILTYHNGHDALHAWVYANLWFFCGPGLFFFAAVSSLIFYTDYRFGVQRQELVAQELSAWPQPVVADLCRLSACPPWLCQMILYGH